MPDQPLMAGSTHSRMKMGAGGGAPPPELEVLKRAGLVKRLHNPSSDKTIQLFKDYAGVDVTSDWKWNHVEPQAARERLNAYLKLRGDVVHRSRPIAKGSPPPHPVTKDDLYKTIVFLKELVKSTERALGQHT